MRRITVLVLVVALTLLVTAPVTAAASCARLTGFATIETDPSTSTATGSALVVHGGSPAVVPFDSALGPTTATQHWFFAAGTVTLLEHAAPVAIPGTTLLTIDSDVEVAAGGTGALTYRGLFDTATNTGAFVVRGRLCIDG